MDDIIVDSDAAFLLDLREKLLQECGRYPLSTVKDILKYSSERYANFIRFNREYTIKPS